MQPVRNKKWIEETRKVVQRKLNEKRPLTGKQLDVVDFELDDDGWLYLVVAPSQAGVRAYDYAKALAEVELELREDGIDKVLLVPAMPDFSPTERGHAKGGYVPPASGRRTKGPGRRLPAKRKSK